MNDLFGDSTLSGNDLKAMQLGLSHSLSRYKLKFSADKVDTMVVQAVGLLDDLDKEINIYAMRTREWYGWHFPEMGKIVADHVQYAKCILTCGMRQNYAEAEFSSFIEDEHVIESVKNAAQLSMGTEISDADIDHIKQLASQVVSLMEYRVQLFTYLKNRMNAIAPNLTLLVGELVGARLISHAGSLMNLAKCPASTVQILGAEKALFRALKTKHDTPKYGLIYHASLIGQAAPKNKGKISRVLAAKTSLAIRVDALSEDATADTAIGYECRAKVEARLRQLEGGTINIPKGSGELTSKKTAKYVAPADTNGYNAESDMVGVAPETPKSDKKKKSKKEKSEKKEKKKRKAEEIEDDDEGEKKKKKKKKDKKSD
jgi:nucleolar protein 58